MLDLDPDASSLFGRSVASSFLFFCVVHNHPTQIVKETTLPITNMYPTHVSSRGADLLEDGKKWIRAGGVVDFTADTDEERETEYALIDYYQSGIDMTKVTLSSDAYGSNPTFDSNGKLISYDMMLPVSTINQIRKMIFKVGFEIFSRVIQCRD